MKIVGIDYGHGETSAGYVNSETVIGNEIHMQDLKISGEQIVIPSVICKTQSGEFIINPSANQLAKADSVGICFKAPIVGNERYEKISEENKMFFRAFISEVYSSIVSNDNNPLHVDNEGNMDFKVYIACPSGWDDTQIEAYKDFVRTECKIPLIDIVKESRAAYIAARRKVGNVAGIRTQGGNVLVIDYGSSTIDFTYFNNNSKFEPIHEGYPYGASQVEKDVLSYLINSNPDAKHNVDLVKHRCGDLMGMNSLLFAIRQQKEKYFSSDNYAYFNPSIHLRELLLDKTLTGLYIEAKEELGISKNQLTEIILKDYIISLSEMLDDFQKIDGVTTIDKVILTGGASRMFFFKDLVAEKYSVSKNEKTLIIDLEPSFTISQGIAAFGYMNEISELSEKPLWDDVNHWIIEQLPALLRSTIEKSIGDMYYDVFMPILNNYKEGKIIKDGKHNLDGLEDKYLEVLANWSSNEGMMSVKIAEAVQNSIKESTEAAMKKFAQTWGFGTPTINIDFSFTHSLSLTVDSCKYLNSLIWEEIKKYISDRDFWPFDPNTSPFRERDYSDRSGIVAHVNGVLRTYFNNLNYEDDLSSELNEIANQIKEKVQNFVDEAKLQQYR